MSGVIGSYSAVAYASSETTAGGCVKAEATVSALEPDAPQNANVVPLLTQFAEMALLLATSRTHLERNVESFGLAHHYQPMGTTSVTKKHPAQQDQKINGYRQVLLKKRASALAGLGAQTHHLVQAERTCEEDLALSSQEEAVSLRLNGHEYKQLRHIQEALDSMQLGEYGVCLSCGEVIPAKRLNAVPWAKYCVRCQEKLGDGFLERV